MYGRTDAKKSSATRRRHHITIQTCTFSRDNDGGTTESWADTTSTWGSIDPMSALQKGTFRGIDVDATHYILIDGNITISENQRIKYGTRIFEIVTVEDMQERSFDKLVTCKERRD